MTNEPLFTAFVNSIRSVPEGLAFDIGRYVIAATVIFAVVWVMRRSALAYRQIQPRLAKGSDYAREFFASIRTCFIYGAVGIGVGTGARTGFLQEVQVSLGLWTDLAIFVGIVVAHDAYFYWAHRAMHHPKLFRTFHRLHHRSVTPTPFAAYAFDIPEAVVMTLFLPLWMFFVPTPVSVIFAWLAFMIVRNAMGHAGVELHPRWWLKTPLTRWINTTVHHDLHHCGGFNRNYGLYFTWWDKICGTEHEGYQAKFEEVVSKPEAADASTAATQPA